MKTRIRGRHEVRKIEALHIVYVQTGIYTRIFKYINHVSSVYIIYTTHVSTHTQFQCSTNFL